MLRRRIDRDVLETIFLTALFLITFTIMIFSLWFAIVGDNAESKMEEEILYDILVVEYATSSCTQEELNDYLYAYQNEINGESKRVLLLLDMIDEQINGND